MESGVFIEAETGDATVSGASAGSGVMFGSFIGSSETDAGTELGSGVKPGKTAGGVTG